MRWHKAPPCASERSSDAGTHTGDRSLKSCEKVGWQAKAPAPHGLKSLRTNVGQTLSSVNAVHPEAP